MYSGSLPPSRLSPPWSLLLPPKMRAAGPPVPTSASAASGVATGHRSLAAERRPLFATAEAGTTVF